ncbi:hypothetical protein B0H65DRAFT_426318, partial [Neurospora tetraspora]
PDRAGPNTPPCTGRNFRNPTSSVTVGKHRKPGRTGCIPVHLSPHFTAHPTRNHRPHQSCAFQPFPSSTS